MDSSNRELNATNISPEKFEHETTSTYTSDSNLKTQAPPTTIDKIALHPKENTLNNPSSSSESSSSPDSPLDDPFRNHNHDSDSDSDSDDDDKSISRKTTENPVTKLEPPNTNAALSSSSSAATTTEAPPNQEMERSAYRIPASVFETSPSSKPNDWSVASNESLFSIHTGNMSFTNDHIFWRSGELCTVGGDQVQASTSTDHMFSYSADQSNGGLGADMRSRELGLAEATMKEVIKESECHDYETPMASARHCRRSQGSDASTKSFAFSLMGGETEKSASSVRMPSSVRSDEEHVHSQPPAVHMTKAESTKADQPKTPTATPNAAQSNWFSCLNCFSCGKS